MYSNNFLPSKPANISQLPVNSVGLNLYNIVITYLPFHNCGVYLVAGVINYIHNLTGKAIGARLGLDLAVTLEMFSVERFRMRMISFCWHLRSVAPSLIYVVTFFYVVE